MSADIAWMPFYGADFFESEAVEMADLEAEAIYLRLLWRQWRRGHLPGDPDEIARLLPGKAFKRFSALWKQIEPCFPLAADGTRQNPRCAAERDAAIRRLDAKTKGAYTANEVKRGRARSALNASHSGTLSATDSVTDSDTDSVTDSAAQSGTLSGPTSHISQSQSPLREIQSPPSPLAGGANAATDSGNAPPPPEPEPRRQRPRRKPAEPWADVLERPEFAPLRESEPFVFGWKTWISNCREAGSNAREPQGQRAVAMFNEALRVGPAKYAAALDQAIASGWKAPHVAALERDSASRAGPPPNIAQRNFDSLREQAERLFGKETA